MVGRLPRLILVSPFSEGLIESRNENPIALAKIRVVRPVLVVYPPFIPKVRIIVGVREVSVVINRGGEDVVER